MSWGWTPPRPFIDRARRMGGDVAGLSFVSGDGRELPFEDGSFDAVVCHTSLCHIPGPDAVLAEAHRMTAEGGLLAVFDGDYATTTVATAEADPLQACAEAQSRRVHDRMLVRRLQPLVRAE